MHYNFYWSFCLLALFSSASSLVSSEDLFFPATCAAEPELARLGADEKPELAQVAHSQELLRSGLTLPRPTVFSAQPRIALHVNRIRFFLNYYNLTWMNNVEANCALEEVRRRVGSLVVLVLGDWPDLGLLEPPIQFADGAESAHWQLRVEAATLLKHYSLKPFFDTVRKHHQPFRTFASSCLDPRT